MKEMKKIVICYVVSLVASFAVSAQSAENPEGSLLRDTPTKALEEAMQNYLRALDDSNQNVESIMVVQHGKVVAEHFRGKGKPDVPHTLWSVSKAFTSTAVGFAVAEGKLKLTDKVISFFPEDTPKKVSKNLNAMEVQHLLTMTCGQDKEVRSVRQEGAKEKNWVKAFLEAPVPHKPGTYFVYNSLSTFMLSAIVQKVTGEKLVDYLSARLFNPLRITDVQWEENPQGINTGGWGLSLKTEDLAKMGLFLLQKGKWNGQQLLPKEWIEKATSAVVPSVPPGTRPEEVLKLNKETSDWLQGYGYQFWQCRYHYYRADGAHGQLIVVMPEKQAVIAVTAYLDDMQAELNLIWKHIAPAL